MAQARLSDYLTPSGKSPSREREPDVDGQAEEDPGEGPSCDLTADQGHGEEEMYDSCTQEMSAVPTGLLYHLTYVGYVEGGEATRGLAV